MLSPLYIISHFPMASCKIFCLSFNNASRCEYLCVYPHLEFIQLLSYQTKVFHQVKEALVIIPWINFSASFGEESTYMFFQVVSRIQVLVFVELKSLFHCWLPAESHFQLTGPPTFLVIYSLPFLKLAVDNISCIKSFPCFTCLTFSVSVCYFQFKGLMLLSRAASLHFLKSTVPHN